MKSIYTFLGATLTLLASCTHYHYVPNTHNVPGFKEKGEAKATLGFSNGNDYSGQDLQLAYAPAKHIGVMLNGFRAKGQKGNNSDEKGFGYFGEVGAGAWFPLKNNWIAEGYGGFGHGYVENQQSSGFAGIGYRSYNFNRGFGQANLVHRGHFTEIGFTTRVIGLFYNKLRINKEPIPGDTDEGWFYMAEPGFMFSGGGERFKVSLFLTRSFLLSPTILEVENYNFSIGINYRLGKNVGKGYPTKKPLTLEN
jgi:hypothetical protein